MKRRAFTLVELLVVIAIIGAVTIATIPLMTPALESRRIRESARLFNTVLSQAQAEAVATGKPCGVWIARLPNELTAAMDLFTCETPQRYAGDTVGSTVNVSVTANGTQANVVTSQGGPQQTVTKYKCTITLSGSDIGWVGLLKPGDTVRFSYRGAWYQILQGTAGLDANGYFKSTQSVFDDVEPVDQESYVYDYTNYPTNPRTKITPVFPGMPPAATGGSWSTTYQIQFQPAKASNSPSQLQAGAVIDLYYSGMGVTNSFGNPANSNPVLVMFDKAGGLDGLYLDGVRQNISGPLFFLIGKREKLASLETTTANQNPADLENMWIGINPQTGLATTAEMFAGTTLAQSRTYAQAAQSVGGR